MFTVTMGDIAAILSDYGVTQKAVSFTELERCKDTPEQVRLIVKACLSDGTALVIRLKNESDVSLPLVERQSQFAAVLRANGIITPTLYRNGADYAKWYSIGGYPVIVTVEEFVEGELQVFDAEAAEMAGRLLANMHHIAERTAFHVDNGVLFDPFTHNSLFLDSDFIAHGRELSAIDGDMYEKIVRKLGTYKALLSPLCLEPRYAVQGDMSDCNLYRTDAGALGVFDFNRCGDNHLFCDAVMQALFVSRLMAYPDSYGDCPEQFILPAFLHGYSTERPFSAAHSRLYPYLVAIIRAFWSADIRWGQDSLLKNLARGANKAVRAQLASIYDRLLQLDPPPV